MVATILKAEGLCAPKASVTNSMMGPIKKYSSWSRRSLPRLGGRQGTQTIGQADPGYETVYTDDGERGCLIA